MSGWSLLGDQQLSLDPMLLGTGTTNPSLGSVVPLEGLGFYQVVYQIVPVAHGGNGNVSNADSKNISGSLAYVSTSSVGLTAREVKLGRLEKITCWKDGAEFKTKGHVVTINAVRSGDTVTLYFGRDAIRKSRTTPLWAVGPVTSDCVVTIFETPGLVAHDAGVTLEHTDALLRRAYYSGRLTGETWKQCSPPFSVDEVETLLAAAGDPAEVRAAVKAIFSGQIVYDAALGANKLECAYPDATDPTKTRVLKLVNIGSGGNNCSANVSGFDGVRDVAPRVHPYTYAAVLNAAFKTNLTQIYFTSSWRPMLGSCAHRHGLGLDLGIIKRGTEEVSLRWTDAEMTPEEKAVHDAMLEAEQKNKEAQTKLKTAQDAARTAKGKYDAAKTAYDNAAAAVEAKTAAVTKAQTASDAAATELTNANKAITDATEAGLAVTKAMKKRATTAALQAPKKAQKLTAAKEALTKAETTAKDLKTKLDEAHADLTTKDAAVAAPKAEADAAAAKEKAARDAWNAQTLASDKPLMAEFRKHLLVYPKVDEVIDPWRIDLNTRDNVAHRANSRKDGVDEIHLNHLHVTAMDADYTGHAR